MKLNKTVNKYMDKVKDQAEEFISTIMMYLKKHKKLIIIGACIYFAYNWLFSEDE